MAQQNKKILLISLKYCYHFWPPQVYPLLYTFTIEQNELGPGFIKTPAFLLWSMFLQNGFQLLVNSNVHFYCAVLATWFLGGCVSVVPPLLRPLNLAKQLHAVDIKHVFCGPCSVENVVRGIQVLNKNKSEDQIEVKLSKNPSNLSNRFFAAKICVNFLSFKFYFGGKWRQLKIL